jgi:hypothetical protein
MTKYRKRTVQYTGTYTIFRTLCYVTLYVRVFQMTQELVDLFEDANMIPVITGEFKCVCRARTLAGNIYV